MKAEKLKGHLDAMLLAILEESPAHGYAVIVSLRDRSGGSLDLPEGTVYPALHRLEEAGLLRSKSQTVTGRRRRVYELTRRGRTALRASRAEWKRFAGVVNSVMRGDPWPA